MSTISDHPERLLAQTSWLRALTAELVADPHTADDVAQDTMLAALRAAGPTRGPLRSWLGGIARNVAASTRRTAARRRERALVERAAPAEGFDLHRTVVDAVHGLDEPYREIVLMRFWEGLPPRAIAARLELPVETVRTRLKRGLAQLRARLDRHAGDRKAWAVPLTLWAQAQGFNALRVAMLAVGALLLGGVAWAGWNGFGRSAPIEAADPVLARLETEGEPAEPEVIAPVAAAARTPLPEEPVVEQPPELTVEWLFDPLGEEVLTGAGGKYGGRRVRHRMRERGMAHEGFDEIDKSLEWLAAQQREDGGWSGGSEVAATGFALLTFLGDGNDTTWGPNHETVRRAVRWLCAAQDDSGSFGADVSVFDHAVATWALVEGYGLSPYPRARPYAVAALSRLDDLREPTLAWSSPMPDGSTDVAVVTAVAAFARSGGRDFRLSDARDDLDTLLAATRTRAPFDAAELALRIWVEPSRFDVDRHEPGETKDLIARLVDTEPTSLMAAHLRALSIYQVGGDPWRAVAESVKVAARERRADEGWDGSWDPFGPWSESGGRVVATALATLTQQAYYRFTRLVR